MKFWYYFYILRMLQIFHLNDIISTLPSIISMSIQTGIHKRLLQYLFFIILIFLQGILMIMSIPLSKRDTRKRVDCVSCNMHLHELVHNATWVLSFTSYLFSLRTIIIMLNKIIIQRDNYNSLTWKTN